ncbi:hypothetical protein [uncultured Acetobacteroides sp.]|uniref:hypothetical protein n=1 Tax=uncultured Acetobacteroides sp. TaxID=1760811 RepID=UPI0029F516B5|nr:hypothetical protein [uncultured Acetobacteroides sp.]
MGIQNYYDINYKWQLVNAHNTNNYYLRSYVYGWGNYYKIWHSGNFDPFNLNCSTISITNNINNTRSLKMLYQGSWGTPEFATNFRFIDIASSEEGSIFQMNAYGVGIGYNPPNYASSDRLYIKGRVGILTASPRYELDVIGTIRAREIKVDLNGADFVFEKDFKLMTLNELEKFVTEQKHLPEIAPAKEMEKNGTELGELNSKLLQKMEEMTLYMIEQNKRIDSIQEQNKLLKKEIELLKAK